MLWNIFMKVAKWSFIVLAHFKSKEDCKVQFFIFIATESQ